MSNLHTDEYPKFIINENKIIIHDGLRGKSETTFTSDFKNKQLFLWICYNSTLNLYKMALCNYSSRVTKTVPKDIDRHRGVRLDYDITMYMSIRLVSPKDSLISTAWSTIKSHWQRKKM